MRGALVPAIQAAIARYVYRSQQCVIFGDGLAGPPAIDRLEDIVFRLATPSDLEHLDELEPYNRGSRQRVYVEQDGDWLFVACHGDRVVATARYGRVVRDALLSRVVQLEPGQVWEPISSACPSTATAASPVSWPSSPIGSWRRSATRRS